MNEWNPEKIRHQMERFNELSEQQKKQVLEVTDVADLDLLTLEGLEISNGLYEDISVRLVLTRASGRFYLDIERTFKDQELNDEFKDETIIKGQNHGWVDVEVVDT